MVQLVIGEKGKGKTKYLLDKVNSEVKTVSGNIVYLDKSTKHMFELNNKVRLIDVSEYGFSESAEFIGFVGGIISQDHDLEQVYCDSFLKIAQIDEDADIAPVIERLELLGDKFNVNFILSVSCSLDNLADTLKSKVIYEL